MDPELERVAFFSAEPSHLISLKAQPLPQKGRSHCEMISHHVGRISGTKDWNMTPMGWGRSLVNCKFALVQLESDHSRKGISSLLNLFEAASVSCNNSGQW